VQPQAPPRRVMIEPPPNSNGGPVPPAVARGNSEEVVEGAGPEPTPEVTRYRAPRPRATNISYGSRTSRLAAAPDARAQEVATEFIPLVQAGPYTPSEEGHLVRVELPRSALVSFGLPVNAEAAGGRVKADVLMGQDGIARAIRFVR
jgi:hypothetical protein